MTRKAYKAQLSTYSAGSTRIQPLETKRANDGTPVGRKKPGKQCVEEANKMHFEKSKIVTLKIFLHNSFVW